MVTLSNTGVYLIDGHKIIPEDDARELTIPSDNTSKSTSAKETARKGTMAYRILQQHNTADNMDRLKIKFDAMTSHDITYVGIVQTARASGLEKFPIPYVLTNCHNSLCAVGGTINEDDHMFGLSAAKKYGGIYVPAHQAVIHSYMREMMSGCGKMILGSDSHTRYGALGTMAIGEGGPELVKQLLGKTYDINCPEVVAVYLTGKPDPRVGPQDVALAIIGTVFKNGYVKNKVMEFVGDGIKNLNVEYRNGIDVMTTETTCLSSIWATDEKVQEYFAVHGRPNEYKELKPADVAYYDGLITVDLSAVKPMIAMPFHPSNTYTIEELNANLGDILREVERVGAEQLDAPNVQFKLTDKIVNGKLKVDQGIIAGCAGGTYDNLIDAADIIGGHSIGSDEFAMSVYPGSQPIYLELVNNGSIAKFMEAGISVKTAFCGPCFGAGDVPANGALSIRHTTRNFPSREGSKPGNNQIASVALMDARSIAATAVNGGYLTPATDLDVTFTKPVYHFNRTVYQNRVHDSYGKGNDLLDLKFGPNIADWPKMSTLTEDMVLKVVSEIHDPVTTTDELIPSGETSSYRSNPLKLAEFALSRKDPAYVGRAKEVQKAETARLAGGDPVAAFPELAHAVKAFTEVKPIDTINTGIGSVIFAVKPGDGSAREQAASCQKVLGGWANIANEYATKRYRSNLINWGMLPFLIEQGKLPFKNLDYIFVPGIRKAVEEKADNITAYALSEGKLAKFNLTLGQLTDDERNIILSGCLINYYRGE
ncbi:aconitate hydratase [Hydrogenoanaerobacterium saccharovorans]|uniref:Aconitate hydratase n=1 Tax=Hydrogenoanaerobacterium saccharovorans TaxID=474960 RepID=A0A1H8DGY9_9FIRM|nr:hydratase [Hydrogenoanaerobacterium saccharovorans]RPF42202.1 aconitate hydratase [Hydrogenoanaerobacterium saccharovorans]SEN06435.1 aconitate hydratase [Hydrogenoanaerobacterium saccharovorans]